MAIVGAAKNTAFRQGGRCMCSRVGVPCDSYRDKTGTQYLLGLPVRRIYLSICLSFFVQEGWPAHAKPVWMVRVVSALFLSRVGFSDGCSQGATSGRRGAAVVVELCHCLSLGSPSLSRSCRERLGGQARVVSSRAFFVSVLQIRRGSPQIFVQKAAARVFVLFSVCVLFVVGGAVWGSAGGGQGTLTNK